MHNPSAAAPDPVAPRDADLALRVLGEPSLGRIAADGSRHRVLGMGKPLALITYLAVAPQHEASREFLADLLWGDDSVSDPPHSLRNALLLIRQQADSTLIDATPTRCRLARPLPSDLGCLTQALGARDLERAMATYTGDFFAQFAAPGCRQFEHWSESVRLRVRTDVANAADVLVRQLLDAGRSRDAEQYARRMIEIDPLNQRGRRVLLETLIAAGDRMAALTEAAVTERWLESEEVEPEAATTAMLQHARRARPVPRASTGPGVMDAPEPLEASTDLVGRAAEFAAIIGAWEEARAGTTATVSIVAGAGIGKSRLLSDVENRLRVKRNQVVSLRALTDERDVPFSFVAALAAVLARLPGAAAVSTSTGGLLVGLDSSLASVFRAPADFAASDQVLRRARALQELLTCVAHERTTVLLLDDLHWADDASLAVLPAMLARMTATRVLVVTASRPGRGAVLASNRTRHLTLAPLSVEQIGQLVASIRSLPQQPWGEALVRGVYAASHGVPVFALLALRDATTRGLVRVGETTWECDCPAALDVGLRNAAALPTALRDLPPRARRVLVQLAVTGRGVPAEMLADAADPAPSLALNEALDTLERRALIVRVGDLVSVAHDVVAESALAGASDLERQSATRSMALAMLRANDRRWQERGLRLFTTVATAREIAPRLAPLVREATLPHGVSVARSFGTWLGESPEHARLAREVARELPLSLRLRPYRRHLAAAGAAASLFATIPLWRVTHPETPVDATLVSVVAPGDSAAQSFDVPLTMAGWNAATAIDGQLAASGAAATSLFGSVPSSRVLQATGERLSDRAYSDSGGDDIDVTNAEGRVTRLTAAPGDDDPGSWSPDGRFVVFESSRWSPLRHHRLGILDRATGAVRRLGGSDGSAGNGTWSPDGSRIAFTRNFLDGRPAQLCVVSVNGADVQCTAAIALPLGWRTPREILAWYGTTVLAIRPDAAWAVDTVVNQADVATLSPNGRWLAWRSGSVAQGVAFVAPSNEPRQARRVQWPNAAGARGTLVWGRGGVPAPYIVRLTITSPADTILVGVPHRFRVIAKWSDSSEATPPYVRWRLGAAGDGNIDSIGTLVARRAGTMVVVATAGGWRTTSRRVVAVAATSRLLATEQWSHGLTAWRAFGDPAPILVQHPGVGGALLNNGDGSYFSGAYYRPPLRWERGLAIDAIVSTPVTELQWQLLDLDLRTANSHQALEAWDHRTGYMPSSGNAADPECIFVYPGREGMEGLVTIIPLATPAGSGARQPLSLANGRPYRVRLQVFPDGRCGMAVNGAPLFVSRERFGNLAPLRLVTYGKSWKTRILLGAVTIHEGVPDDIDWTVISRVIPATMPPGPTQAFNAPRNRQPQPAPKR